MNQQPITAPQTPSDVVEWESARCRLFAPNLKARQKLLADAQAAHPHQGIYKVQAQTCLRRPEQVLKADEPIVNRAIFAAQLLEVFSDELVMEAKRFGQAYKIANTRQAINDQRSGRPTPGALLGSATSDARVAFLWTTKANELMANAIETLQKNVSNREPLMSHAIATFVTGMNDSLLDERLSTAVLRSTSPLSNTSQPPNVAETLVQNKNTTWVQKSGILNIEPLKQAAKTSYVLRLSEDTVKLEKSLAKDLSTLLRDVLIPNSFSPKPKATAETVARKGQAFIEKAITTGVPHLPIVLAYFYKRTFPSPEYVPTEKLQLAGTLLAGIQLQDPVQQKTWQAALVQQWPHLQAQPTAQTSLARPALVTKSAMSFSA